MRLNDDLITSHAIDIANIDDRLRCIGKGWRSTEGQGIPVPFYDKGVRVSYAKLCLQNFDRPVLRMPKHQAGTFQVAVDGDFLLAVAVEVSDAYPLDVPPVIRVARRDLELARIRIETPERSGFGREPAMGQGLRVGSPNH